MITAGPITLDPQTREVRVWGHTLLLSDGEFDVLRELAREPYAPITRRELRYRVGGDRSPAWIDCRLFGVRQKLRRVGIAPTCCPASHDGVVLFEQPVRVGEAA